MAASLTAEAGLSLLQIAHKALLMAYVPYSHFSVGAAILFEDGTVVSGCNVENASYSLSLCAKRNAMTTAVAEGKKNPLAIAIVSNSGRLCPPCGACRQFLTEFAPDMDVVLEDAGKPKFLKLSFLLPAGFSKGDMAN